MFENLAAGEGVAADQAVPQNNPYDKYDKERRSRIYVKPVTDL